MLNVIKISAKFQILLLLLYGTYGGTYISSNLQSEVYLLRIYNKKPVLIQLVLPCYSSEQKLTLNKTWNKILSLLVSRKGIITEELSSSVMQPLVYYLMKLRCLIDSIENWI